jgi:GT2 family glycosyltransferase
VGGFDEVYGLGTWEDVDYCMKVRELGYNILVNPKAVGTHFTGATAEFYKIGYPMDQNRMVFLSKWATKIRWSEVERW